MVEELVLADVLGGGGVVGISAFVERPAEKLT
jgi:hypothetical protein